MRKFLIPFCIIALFPFLFGIHVNAESGDLIKEIALEFEFEIPNTTTGNNFASTVENLWNEGGVLIAYRSQSSSTSTNQMYFYICDHYEESTSQYLLYDVKYNYCQYYNGAFTAPTVNYYLQTATINKVTGGYYNKAPIVYGEYNNIDFDNVFYSPMIPTPILNPYYTSYNESGINIPYVPLTFDLSNVNENYYIQIKQKNYTPSVVTVEGANKFNVQARNAFQVHDVYEMRELFVSTDFSRGDFYNDISDNWTNDLNEFVFSNVQMINGLQSTIGSTADAYFLAQTAKYQQLRNIQTVYGNIIEIWARYFMVDENDNVVVGKWYHWWSLSNDSFDEQLPEYVIPYEKAYGTENTSDQNNAPDGTGTTSGTGTSSNPNQNYTYVSVVPNYPDYPTIASYNKDNLLVDTITRMTEVKSFFGEFNDFLAVSFVWVPNWIWGLIGIGFGLSIIVFFLRML